MNAPVPNNNNNGTNNGEGLLNYRQQMNVGLSSKSSSSWFLGAPFTKFWAIASVFVYGLTVHLNNITKEEHRKSYFKYNYEEEIYYSNIIGATFEMDTSKISDNAEYYRFFSSKFIFSTKSSIGEWMISTLLLVVLMRKFEREVSSKKMFLFIVYATFGTVLLEFLLFIVFFTGEGGTAATDATTASAEKKVTLERLLRYCGPYGLLGSLMYYYNITSPRVYPKFLTVAGFNFSEKTLHYLWFFQVAFSIGNGGASSNNSIKQFSLTTILPTLLGVLVSYILLLPSLINHKFLFDYILPTFLYNNAIIRSIVYNILEVPSRIIAPMIATHSIPVQQGNNNNNPATALLGGGPRRRPFGRPMYRAAAATERNRQPNNTNAPGITAASVAAATAAATAATAAAAQPSEEAINQLTGMGFERQKVIEALKITNNHVERAADRLLAG